MVGMLIVLVNNLRDKTPPDGQTSLFVADCPLVGLLGGGGGEPVIGLMQKNKAFGKQLN